MSAKDNFAQAMKELLNGGEGEGKATEAEEKKPAPSTFSSFSQPESRPPRAPAPEKKADRPSLFGGSAAPAKEEPIEEAKEMEKTQPEAVAETKEEAVSNGDIAERMPVADAGTTVIAEGTTIVGDITTAGGLQIGGNVKGNLKVAADLELNGKVIGDIEADSVKITNSVIKGNVTVRNDLSMDRSTTIIGDVEAKNTRVNGQIKGNLTVEERGHFESNAILVGNLVSGTMIIDEGAMLRGDIAITQAQKDNITVEEPEFDIEL